jgi:hypothetical protein
VFFAGRAYLSGMRQFLSLLRAGALLVILACGLAVAACGDSDSSASDGSNSSPGASSSSNEQDAARVRLQNCLRENGIDLPEGGGGPGGGGQSGEPPNIDRDELEKAMEACEEFRDDAFGDVTEEDRQELEDAFTKFSQCMRDEGVDVPDVEFGGGGGPPGGGEQLDRDDPDVQAAMEKCQDELPQGRGPGGGPGGP